MNPDDNIRRERVRRIREWANQASERRSYWKNRSAYFHLLDLDYLRFLVPAGQRVLALGCGLGSKLAAVEPKFGVGVDLSENKVERARASYPNLIFEVGDIEDPNVISRLQAQGPFDIILLCDSLGFVWDIQKFLEGIRALCTEETKIISVYYSYFWEPLLKMLEIMHVRMRTFDTTWLTMQDVERFLILSGYEVVKKEWRTLCPAKLAGIGMIVNKVFGTLPILRKLSLRHFVVARLKPAGSRRDSSVTVVIPCRNEEGNIEDAVQRLPALGTHTEVIFVEGNSQDNTWSEINRVRSLYAERDIKAIRQPGRGKGDAVREGFKNARGEILMILDADLTVAPEDLPKFYEEVVSGRGEYVQGSRLVYSMETEAMRFLNYVANRFFAAIFSFLLNQTFSDTLCGTKVISKKNFERVAQGRSYFGEFDPFGDFDLIFGATKLNLKISEVPIRYRARQYGTTQISRFRHGFMLIRMVIFAFRKLKLV